VVLSRIGGMNKIILVVYLLSGHNDVEILYTVKTESPKACLTLAETEKDQRKSGFITYPVRYAKCVIEIKQ
jgi:hypothetical protein